MKLFKTQVSGCPIKSNLDKTLDELERSWEVFGWASACKFGGVAQSHTCKYQGLVKSDTNRTSGWHWQFLFVQLRAASFTTRHTHHWSEGSLLGKVVGNMISQRRVDWFCVHFIETHPFSCYFERGLKSTNTNVWFQLLSGCPDLKTSSKRGCYCTAQFEP